MLKKQSKLSKQRNIYNYPCANCIRYILEDENIITHQVNCQNLEVLRLFCEIDSLEVRKNIISLLKTLHK